jgi:DNA polymerase III alpha subunit (gram-positive type)
MASRTEISIAQAIPSVTKSITENSILGFESTGILERDNIHNNPEMAATRGKGTAEPRTRKLLRKRPEG